MNLFAKQFDIINAEILFKNSKKCIGRNQNQNKDETDMFEVDNNANIKKNNETIVDSDYSSNSM